MNRRPATVRYNGGRRTTTRPAGGQQQRQTLPPGRVPRCVGEDHAWAEPGAETVLRDGRTVRAQRCTDCNAARWLEPDSHDGWQPIQDTR